MTNTLIIKNSFVRVLSPSDQLLSVVIKATSYHDKQIYWEKQRLYKLMRMAANKGNHKWLYALKDEMSKLGPDNVCLFKNGCFPTGLFQVVQDALGSMHYQVLDERVSPEPSLILRPNNSVSLRYYQVEAMDAALKAGRGVVEAACGSGKTMILLGIINDLRVNTLVIVPTAALLEQTGNDLITTFGSKVVEKIETSKVKQNKSLKPIRISTIQTLTSLLKQGLVNKVLDDIDCLIIDEFQFAGAKSYTDLMPLIDHVFYRFGFTGSFTRQSRLMDLYGVLSNVIYSFPPKKATAEGFLKPIHYVVKQLPGQRKMDYMKEYRANYENNPVLLKAIKELVQSILSNESILILVERKDRMGNILHGYLTNNGIENSWVSGDNSKEEINQAIYDFNDLKIKVLIASTVCGVGVDIRAAQHLIWARGGKSEVAFVQGVGRAARLFPGKQAAFVHDFSFSNTKYLNKHLKDRLAVFKEYFDGEVKGE